MKFRMKLIVSSELGSILNKPTAQVTSLIVRCVFSLSREMRPLVFGQQDIDPEMIRQQR